MLRLSVMEGKCAVVALSALSLHERFQGGGIPRDKIKGIVKHMILVKYQRHCCFGGLQQCMGYFLMSSHLWLGR